MSTRTKILSGQFFSSERTTPYFLHVFRDENGVIHRIEDIGFIEHVEDFPEGPIDHCAYQPPFLTCWTEWQGAMDDIYIKEANYYYPPVRHYGKVADDKERAHIAQKTTMREICILESLRRHPHPNICPYLGCIVSPHDKHVEALAFKPLSVTLDEVLSKNRFDHAVGREISSYPPLDNVIANIRSATTHLQSLGYLYMDFKGANIMWDPTPDNETSGRWCLIDFSECYVPGTRFKHGINGTPGWMDDDATVVTVELLASLHEKLEEYVLTGLEPLPLGTTREEEDANFRLNVAGDIAHKQALERKAFNINV